MVISLLIFLTFLVLCLVVALFIEKRRHEKTLKKDKGTKKPLIMKYVKH